MGNTIDKIYKLVRFAGSSYDKDELGTFGSLEKAERALDCIINQPFLSYLRSYIPTECYEIEEYALDVLPPDWRCKEPLRSLCFDYEGNFVAEHGYQGDEFYRICLGHIDCDPELEVYILGGYIPDSPLIHVWDVETYGNSICAYLDLINFNIFNNIGYLTDKQIRAVFNLLKKRCRNKRFRTNWDYALMYWNAIISPECLYKSCNTRHLHKDLKLPDADKFIKFSNRIKEIE